MAHVGFTTTLYCDSFSKNVCYERADGSYYVATRWDVTEGPRPPTFRPGDEQEIIDKTMERLFIKEARALQREWDAEEKKAEAGAERVKRRKIELDRRSKQE